MPARPSAKMEGEGGPQAQAPPPRLMAGVSSLMRGVRPMGIGTGTVHACPPTHGCEPVLPCDCDATHAGEAQAPTPMGTGHAWGQGGDGPFIWASGGWAGGIGGARER